MTSNSFQLLDLVPFPEHVCSKPYFGTSTLSILPEQSLLFLGLSQGCLPVESNSFYAVSKSGTKHVLSPNAILLPESQPRGQEWHYQAFAVWQLTCGLGSRWFQAAGWQRYSFV